jgi:hypothetical protein
MTTSRIDTNHLECLLIAVDSLYHALTEDPGVVDEQVQPVAFLVDLRTRASFNHQPRNDLCGV